MHENIKRYSLTGEVKYEYLSQVREELERTVEDQMRLEGYVPVLDMDTQLTQSLRPDGNFSVTMSIYGAYVGDKAWKTAGLMTGKPIMRYIPKAKSKQSS